MQLVSLRSNQTFVVDYKSGKLIPNTEIIILIEKPLYKSKKSSIVRTNEVVELRFDTHTNGLKQLIGMLEEAVKVSDNYEKMGGAINNIIDGYRQDQPE